MSVGRAHPVSLAILVLPLCWPVPAAACQWKPLFDGKNLGRWEVVEKFNFINHGKVEVTGGKLILGMGRPGTGVRYQGRFPEVNYEISLEAMRVEGDDFFCCMTFPVGPASREHGSDARPKGRALSLVVGGWGGPVVGLSLIDDQPAIENETCRYRKFERNRWYNIRVRVSRRKIEAWIDKDKVVDFETKGRKLSIYFEPETALPLGIATWRTTGALRHIRVRRLKIPAKGSEAAEAVKGRGE